MRDGAKKAIGGALEAAWRTLRWPLGWAVFGLTAFAAGAATTSRAEPPVTTSVLRAQLASKDRDLRAREGEMELVRLELDRSEAVMDNSSRYKIPADLAGQIYDIALAEGIDPGIAFRLVHLESEFTHTAVSPKGAVGLTQVMPSTARFFDPSVSRKDLFRRDTNLHIGFAYLRELIHDYGGDLRLALLAYNRGPAVVDAIRRAGGNPENGYARRILEASSDSR